jgi:DNA mismatch repair protein MSH6
MKSRKFSSRRSSVSSRRSTASETDDFEEDTFDLEEASKKSKSKRKGTAATAKSAGSKTAGVSGTFGFLTAAEQRAQGKKQEKKAAEEPYSFLQDVRDVSSTRTIYATLLKLSHG